MKKGIKRFLQLTLLCLAAIIIVAVGWSIMPLSSGIGEDDPAVVFAKQNFASTAAIKESYFKHQGLDLHYIESGQADNDVVLFIHGFPSFWYSFARQIEALHSHYRIIAIDGLGAGRSDAPRDVTAYKLEEMAQHIKALLEHLDVDKVHLVGHDWGAAMVFGYAQKYPEQVKSVTGISAPPQNIMLELLRNNSAQQQRSQYVKRLKSANPVILKAYGASTLIMKNAYLPLVEAGKLSPEEGDLFKHATGDPKRINTHINWYRANIPSVDEIQDDDFWPDWHARLKVPAMVIWGSDDQVFERDFIRLMKNSSDQLKVLELDKVGHWPHVNESQKVNTALQDFLKENS